MKILASTLVLLFICNLAFAHSCLTWTSLNDEEHKNKLQEQYAIFYGEVISTEEPMKNQDEFKFGSQVVKVKVLRIWKGIETNEISLLYTRAYTNFSEEIGGIGTKKIFYAWKRNDDSNLHIDFCSFTLFDNERMKREFGEGKIIEESTIEQSQVTESLWSMLWRKIVSVFS